MKKRIITLSVINAVIISYVAFMFYKSEPEYINNVYRNPQLYDYVIAATNSYSVGRTIDGVVIQTDSNGFVMRYRAGLLNSIPESGLYSFPYKGGVPYRIVGKGTFYHKVNEYIGFNIMFVTILIALVFFGVVFYTEVTIIWSMLNK